MEEYKAKFGKETRELVDIFDFLDKGMEINTNELENPEAKALLLKIFEALNIKASKPGFFQLQENSKSWAFRFYMFMRHMYKQRFSKILEFLEEKYPIKEEDIEAQEGRDAETHNDFKNDSKNVEQNGSEVKKSETESQNILGEGITKKKLLQNLSAGYFLYFWSL